MIKAHDDITMLDIKLCRCCNGTYFKFKSRRIKTILAFYVTEKNVQDFLEDQYPDILLQFSEFDPTTCNFNFDIIKYSSSQEQQICMIEYFNQMYETAINAGMI